MKSPSFKAGDQVRCIDAAQSMCCLTQGKIYEVSTVAPGGGRIYLRDFPNLDWYAHRFELANPSEPS